MPTPSTTNDWPIDYVAVFAWRQQQYLRLKKEPELLLGAKTYYADNPADFINHWCDTYDPRNAGSGLPTRMPFILFKRQEEMVEFLLQCLRGEENALVEKCRDMGATWVFSAFSVWLWLFVPGAAVGWGSRKEQLVDKLGDPDSIFEKMRMIIRGLPKVFMPAGFSTKDHMTYMRIVNPENSATITGEAGDNIGRGGRKLMYFKDESAHYERPEKIEAALADNTRVQVDLSSVNGLGNVFHRRREAGVEWHGELTPGRTQVFVMDWRDHPAKTQEWYDDRKGKAEADGLLHVFAQEVDRNYSAAVDGLIISSEWVDAAVDAHLVIAGLDDGPWVAALDVADGGGDTNALAKRKGVVLLGLTEWGARDTAQTARRALDGVTTCGKVELQYDSIGVGSGVKAEVNNLKDQGKLPKGVKLVSWNAGAKVQFPDDRVIKGDKESPLNKDFYTNLKAQGWWELRNRFYRTWRAVREDCADEYSPDDLVSLSSSMKRLRQLKKELCQPTASRGAAMKLCVDKTPDGTKSPNLADAVMMAYWPIAGKYNLEKMING